MSSPPINWPHFLFGHAPYPHQTRVAELLLQGKSMLMRLFPVRIAQDEPPALGRLPRADSRTPDPPRHSNTVFMKQCRIIRHVYLDSQIVKGPE